MTKVHDQVVPMLYSAEPKDYSIIFCPLATQPRTLQSGRGLIACIHRPLREIGLDKSNDSGLLAHWYYCGLGCGGAHKILMTGRTIDDGCVTISCDSLGLYDTAVTRRS